MVEPQFVYRAKVERVVDGDTLDLFIDLGFRTWKKVRVRLLCVDTPEKYGVKKDSEEYAKGVAATEFVQSWLKLTPDPMTGLVPGSGEVVVTSRDGKELGVDKYGRWLAVVFNADGESLNDALVAAGHAVEVKYGG